MNPTTGLALVLPALALLALRPVDAGPVRRWAGTAAALTAAAIAACVCWTPRVGPPASISGCSAGRSTALSGRSPAPRPACCASASAWRSSTGRSPAPLLRPVRRPGRQLRRPRRLSLPRHPDRLRPAPRDGAEHRRLPRRLGRRRADQPPGSRADRPADRVGGGGVASVRSRAGARRHRAPSAAGPT